MSKLDILKSFSIIGLSAFVGYGSMKYVQGVQSPNRYLASMTVSKMATEQYAKTIFNVEVKNVEIASTDEGVSTVEVKVESFRDVNESVSYIWNLPEEMTVVEGSQQGLLNPFTANQTQTLTLKIKGYSKAKKSFISFELEGVVGQGKMKREVLLSSRPEDSFEYIVQQREKQKFDEVKVQNKLGKKTSYKGPIDINKVVH